MPGAQRRAKFPRPGTENPTRQRRIWTGPGSQAYRKRQRQYTDPASSNAPEPEQQAHDSLPRGENPEPLIGDDCGGSDAPMQSKPASDEAESDCSGTVYTPAPDDSQSDYDKKKYAIRRKDGETRYLQIHHFASYSASRNKLVKCKVTEYKVSEKYRSVKTNHGSLWHCFRTVLDDYGEFRYVKKICWTTDYGVRIALPEPTTDSAGGYTYEIQLNEEEIRYLWIRHFASYGPSLDQLVKCKVQKYKITEKRRRVQTEHGNLSHYWGSEPEDSVRPLCYTTHKAEEMLEKPTTIRAEVARPGSHIFKIQLDNGPAYFCLAPKNETAFYGQDVEALEKCSLLKVDVMRDGGSMSVQSEHGNLIVPSPQDRVAGERLEWQATYQIDKFEGPLRGPTPY